MTDAVVIFTTCASEEEALSIARALVEECSGRLRQYDLSCSLHLPLEREDL